MATTLWAINFPDVKYSSVVVLLLLNIKLGAMIIFHNPATVMVFFFVIQIL
jgi:hypothetical protein